MIRQPSQPQHGTKNLVQPSATVRLILAFVTSHKAAQRSHDVATEAIGEVTQLQGQGVGVLGHVYFNLSSQQPHHTKFERLLERFVHELVDD